MEESVTYQAIVEKGVQKGRIEGRQEGCLEEARRILLRLGNKAFGRPPSSEEKAQVESIGNLEDLEQLTDQVLQVHSWEELLGRTTASQPRRGRKKKE